MRYFAWANQNLLPSLFSSPPIIYVISCWFLTFRDFFLFFYEVWICARSTLKCFFFIRFTWSGRNPTSACTRVIFTSIIAYIYSCSFAGSCSFSSARAKWFHLSSLYAMTFARTDQNSQSYILFHCFLFDAVILLTSCSLIVSTYLGLKFWLDQPKFHIYRRTTNVGKREDLHSSILAAWKKIVISSSRTIDLLPGFNILVASRKNVRALHSFFFQNCAHRFLHLSVYEQKPVPPN